MYPCLFPKRLDTHCELETSVYSFSSRVRNIFLIKKHILYEGGGSAPFISLGQHKRTTSYRHLQMRRYNWQCMFLHVLSIHQDNARALLREKIILFSYPQLKALICAWIIQSSESSRFVVTKKFIQLNPLFVKASYMQPCFTTEPTFLIISLTFPKKDDTAGQVIFLNFYLRMQAK